MSHENYHSIKTLSFHKDESATSVKFDIPARVKAKLKYYASNPDEPMQDLTVEDAIRGLIESEGKNPDDYSAMFAELKKYEVVYPNMFLTEDAKPDAYLYSSEFKPKGVAANRLSQLAGMVTNSIRESTKAIHDPEKTGLNPDKVAEHVDNYLKGALAGPFGAVLDIGEHKPILVLNDFSFTTAQLFRAFSGIYCDFTPTLKISKADFLEYTIFHEIGHKRTEEIMANGPSNTYVPGIEFEVDANSISHENLTENIADAFAVLKHIQRTGSDELPKQIATMRAMDTFSQTKKHFETKLSLFLGGGMRQRSDVGHYTTPSIDEAISRAMPMFKSGQLQKMSDQELTKLAINIGREMKPSAQTLDELCCFATSLTWNTYEYRSNSIMPQQKISISPAVVRLVLDEVEKYGSFQPVGAYAKLEGMLARYSPDPADAAQTSFHSNSVIITDEMKQVFARYREATEYLKSNGLKPFCKETTEHNLRDLTSTISLAANQTPNMTLAREMNDSMASEDKYASIGSGYRYTMIGVDQLIKQFKSTAKGDNEYLWAVEYRRAEQESPKMLDVIVNLFEEDKAKSAPTRQ